MLDFFLSNWVLGQTLTKSWPSDVVASFLDDSEDRRALTTKPRRSFLAEWMGTDRNQSARMLMQLLRTSNEATEVPLYPDQSEVTGTSGAVITCPTSNRRFFVGFKIVIVSPDLLTVERGVILSLTATTITLTAPLAASFDVGSLVFPIMDVLPVLGHTVNYETDELAVVRAEFKEIPGSTALPSLVPTFGDDPLGFPSIASLPVLNLVHNWTSQPELTISRTGSAFIQGKGPAVEVSGLRPVMKHSLEFSPLTRAEAFSLLEFFDSRRGRCLPFWFMAPSSVFQATQAVGPTVIVEALENLLDVIDFIGWIAIEEIDGTIHIEQLLSVATGPGPNEWEFTMVSGFPSIALDQIRKVTTGHLVRFSSDSLQEHWTTDNVSSIALSVTELVNEQTVEVTGL